jgi:hypothetical protein
MLYQFWNEKLVGQNDFSAVLWIIVHIQFYCYWKNGYCWACEWCWVQFWTSALYSRVLNLQCPKMHSVRFTGDGDIWFIKHCRWTEGGIEGLIVYVLSSCLLASVRTVAKMYVA